TLLNDISGEARDGEILAVLGASGSGKSTLIDALANRIAKGSLKGRVSLNGEAIGSRMLKVISAYVMQDDLLFPMLTVEETLTFAAEFRLPRTLSRTKKKARVQALIDQLGLRNAAKTVIGDEEHRGVSGGERRRVSIGIDIIHDPIILFLDEPTSGLDSTSAYMVVKVLQRIAQSGSVVIMSIHQPGSRIMGLLDRMLFLSRGQTVYSGSPTNLASFLSDFGNPIPENENRTEFALDLIRELEGSAGGTKSLVEFNKTWQNLKNSTRKFDVDEDGNGMSLKEAISASISRGKLVSGATRTTTSGDRRSSSSTNNSLVPTFANPFWIEIGVLSKRSVLNSRRMPELFGVRLGAVMVTGFILATVFMKLDDSPKGVQERLGFFAFALSTIFYTCADALPMFLQERYIFMRETAHNAYRRSSYVLSHALVSLPALVFLSLAFSAITFWAVGLDGGSNGFLFYFLVTLASFWTGTSFVTFISGIVPNVLLGFTVVVAILAYFLLFSGFFITRDRIPTYWIWFHYLSLIKYPYEAVMQNEFRDPTKCFVRGVQIFDNSPLGDFPNSTKVELLQAISNTLGVNITASTCLTTSSDILTQQDITQLSNMAATTPTLGQLFKRFGDISKEFPSGEDTPPHKALDIGSHHIMGEPRPLQFVLSFLNLTYSVRTRRRIRRSTAATEADPVTGESLFSTTKTLLNDISGEARDGEILAILGASGSGKSTLIDALANRIAKGGLKGRVSLNGEAIGSRMLKVISAYVMQDDLLFPMLTVEETLTFAAEFRLPRTLSKTKKKARVHALIDQLGLRNSAKTVIGDEEHRGVSGGERRRVSIGIDIIHDPIILFLDEPTSGLDSTSAYMVVKVLQRIAQSGSVVIMSIHQPGSRITGLLDRMLFLSRGQTVYSGSPTNLASFLSDFGHPIPENENRTEFALDLIRELEGSAGGTKSLVGFNKTWQNLKNSTRKFDFDEDGNGMSLKEAISASILRGKLVSGATTTTTTTSGDDRSSSSTNNSLVPTFANPFWIEVGVLSKRSVLNSRRMPELFGVRLGAVMVTGFILATVFMKLDDSPKGLQERLGFFAFALSTTFYTCADALPMFLQERYIFMRETAHNAYRRSSYVLSHALVSLPALVFLSLAFSAITFWAVGLDGSSNGFLFYFLVNLASFWTGTSFVTFVSGIVPNVLLGFTVVVSILAYFLLFSGFFITRDRIPTYWIWFHYLSLIKYPYEAVMQNEFRD
ncbi:ABC_tran domain-containing protein/ABC2_membrane domain-containing protein, partial [Cephalotus follicularis]